MTAANRTVRPALQCHENGSAPAFDITEAQLEWQGLGQRDAHGPAGHRVDDHPDETQRFQRLVETDAGSRRDVALLARGNPNFEHIVRRHCEITPQVARDAARASTESRQTDLYR